jgi:HEAT repeat protein
MTEDEALKFLKKYQPMPNDENLTTELINKYDEIRIYFLENKNKKCIPLLLNSFGYIDGFGVYQLIEDVILQFSMDDVVPYIKECLNSNIYSIRYWNVQIAANYASIELLPILKNMLKENDFDIKYSTLTALGQFDKKIICNIMKEYLDIEKDKELLDLAENILPSGQQSG